jgi:hypothetical protein
MVSVLPASLTAGSAGEFRSWTTAGGTTELLGVILPPLSDITELQYQRDNSKRSRFGVGFDATDAALGADLGRHS